MTASHRKPDQEDLCNLRAIQVLDLIKRKDISPIDLVDASIKRIEEAREEAKSVSFETEIQNPHSPDGMPIAVKYYNDVRGIPTTYGSPIFRSHVPETSDATVHKLMDNAQSMEFKLECRRVIRGIICCLSQWSSLARHGK